MGRASSLPKLWRGTRKRKKAKPQQQQSQTDEASHQVHMRESVASTTTLKATERQKVDNFSIRAETGGDTTSVPLSAGIKNDVFKLFEEAFNDDNQPDVDQVADSSQSAVDTDLEHEKKAEIHVKAEEGMASLSVVDSSTETRAIEAQTTNKAVAATDVEDDDELVYETDDEVSFLQTFKFGNFCTYFDILANMLDKCTKG